MKELFLDANAHIPINTKALKAYNDFQFSAASHGHPSSPSIPGRLAASVYEEARTKIGSLIGAKKPEQIIFTSGCTQAAEWAMEIFTYLSITLIPFYSPFEHPAISNIVNNINDKPSFIKINSDGLLDYSLNNSYVFPKTVCCVHLQNEIGTIQNIKSFQTNYLFSDMSQSLGKIPVNVTEENVDIAIFAGHKFGGPGNFGFMYLKNTSDWEEFGTGSRYFMDRPGTPDVAAAVSTAVALEEAIYTLEDRTKNMIAFQSTIENEFNKIGIEIIGNKAKRSPNTTFICMPGKGLSTMMNLGENGIYTGLGSACGSIHAGESKIIRTLGRNGNIHDFMRISQFGEYGEEDAKHFIKALYKSM